MKRATLLSVGPLPRKDIATAKMAALPAEQERIYKKYLVNFFAAISGQTLPPMPTSIIDDMKIAAMPPKERKKRQRVLDSINKRRSKLTSGFGRDGWTEPPNFDLMSDEELDAYEQKLAEAEASSEAMSLLRQGYKAIPGSVEAAEDDSGYAAGDGYVPTSNMLSGAPVSPPRSIGGGVEHTAEAVRSPVRVHAVGDTSQEAVDSLYSKGLQALNQAEMIAGRQGQNQWAVNKNWGDAEVTAQLNADGSRDIFIKALETVAEVFAPRAAAAAETIAIPERRTVEEETPTVRCITVTVTYDTTDTVEKDWLCEYEYNCFDSMPCGDCGANGEVPAVNCETYYWCAVGCSCYNHTGYKKRWYQRVIAETARIVVTDQDGAILQNRTYKCDTTTIVEKWYQYLLHTIYDCPPENGGYVEAGDETYKFSRFGYFDKDQHTTVVSGYDIDSIVAATTEKFITAGYTICP